MSADILLVDDDLKLLEIVSTSLSRQGYRVRTAATGREALEHATGAPPHLVILDLDLPDMNGIEVLDNIRDDHETSARARALRTERRGRAGGRAGWRRRPSSS
jgi:DNA-binding response OmpR family regulator